MVLCSVYCAKESLWWHQFERINYSSSLIESKCQYNRIQIHCFAHKTCLQFHTPLSPFPFESHAFRRAFHYYTLADWNSNVGNRDGFFLWVWTWRLSSRQYEQQGVCFKSFYKLVFFKLERERGREREWLTDAWIPFMDVNCLAELSVRWFHKHTA